MKPTNKMIHFENGGRGQFGGHSVLGLTIFLDDNNHEFVFYKNKWTHIEDMPLPRKHTVNMGPAKPLRVPVHSAKPAAEKIEQVTGGMGNLPPKFVLKTS